MVSRIGARKRFWHRRRLFKCAGSRRWLKGDVRLAERWQKGGRKVVGLVGARALSQLGLGVDMAGGWRLGFPRSRLPVLFSVTPDLF